MLIEPLVGILRDPLTMCPQFPPEYSGIFQPTENSVQSKRFLLLEPAASTDTVLCVSPMSPVAHCRRRYLFDIGASIYQGWPGHDGAAAVGTRWFVERYATLNLTFDHIYAFEYETHDPKVVFADLPAAVRARYSYINIGIESELHSAWNLWEFIARAATPEDHVTVKLDIDTPLVENELMQQLKSNGDWQTLVDEMFFEHHVNTAVMIPYWGTGSLNIFLNDTYADYLALRQRGLRMHSWP